MLLAIDSGNTNIVFAVFNDEGEINTPKVSNLSLEGTGNKKSFDIDANEVGIIQGIGDGLDYVNHDSIQLEETYMENNESINKAA